MAHGVGQLIQASDFSEIYQRFYQVFGTGSGQTGYGQNYSPITVSTGIIISFAEWENFRRDMIRARQHQIGRLITSSNALDGNNLLPISKQTMITEEIRNQYDVFSQYVVNDKSIVHESQLTMNTLVNRTRQTSWNNRLKHIIKVSSSQLSYDNFRYFFNAGGRLEFNFSRTGGLYTHKNVFWEQFLNKIGTIVFDYNTTSVKNSTASTAVISNIGFYELTNEEQQLYMIAGVGNYSANFVQITAKINNTYDTIVFSITFADDTNEVPIDQNITGYLTSKLISYVPTGINVNVPRVVATDAGLLDGIYQTKYISIINANVVSEGGTSTITVVCNNPTIRQLYWTTAGNVEDIDFDDNILSGILPLSEDGVGTLVRNIKEDKMTEILDTEFYSINFSESYNGPMICTSGSIYIEDTSVYELTVDTTIVDEGEAITYTLNSTSAANGKTLYITFSGIQSSDIVNGFIERPLTINNGTVSGIIRIVEDRFDLGTGDYDSGTETFYIEARQDSSSGQVVARSPRITINDTTPVFTMDIDAYDKVSRSQTLTSTGTWTAPERLIGNSITAVVYGGAGGGGSFHKGCGGAKKHPGGDGGKGDKKTYTVPVVSKEAVYYVIGRGGAGGMIANATKATHEGEAGKTGETSYFKNITYKSIGGNGGECGGNYSGTYRAGKDATNISNDGVAGGAGASNRDTDPNGADGSSGKIELYWKEYATTQSEITANSRVDYRINTTRLPNGTQLYVILTGNISDSDIVGGRYYTITVNNNVAPGSFIIANLSNSAHRDIKIQLHVNSYNGPQIFESDPIHVVVHGSVLVNTTTSFKVPSGVTALNIKSATATGYTDNWIDTIPGNNIYITKTSDGLTINNGQLNIPNIDYKIFKFWGSIPGKDTFEVGIASNTPSNYTSNGKKLVHKSNSLANGVTLTESGESSDKESTINVTTMSNSMLAYASNMNIYFSEFNGRGTGSVTQQPVSSNNYTGIWTVNDTKSGTADYYYAISVKFNTHIMITW